MAAAEGIRLSQGRTNKGTRIPLEHVAVLFRKNVLHKLLSVDVHRGLIVLRESGLTRKEQWDRLAPVL